MTDMTDGMTHGVTYGMADGMTDGMTAGMTDAMTDGMTEGTTDGMRAKPRFADIITSINICIPSECPNTAWMPEYQMNIRITWNADCKAKLADALRQLEGSKAIEDALQSELNTTLTAYAQSKEGNQKLIQVNRPPLFCVSTGG